MKKRALISLTDKTGVVEFAKELEALGYEIVSTGGTAKVLVDNGVSVTSVSDVTGFPECLDGRVKTMHPNICAGILAIRGNSEHMEQLNKLNIAEIDVVAINLYPFKKTIEKEGVKLEEAIENIDIGGPTMLRSAAKNWQDVAVAIDPSDYSRIIAELKNGGLTRELKFELSMKVFEHTAAYDALIASYLRKQAGKDMLSDKVTLTFEKVQDLRYGENPHQAAAFYKEPLAPANSLAMAEQLHGKELSYNNINDANGALDVLKECGDNKPCAVAIKHANPCGVGIGDNLYSAYMGAYNSDPVSIFGGIVAVNRKVDLKTAEEMGKIFLEIIIAPDFDEDALEHLKAKKNIRLLKLADCAKPNCKESLDIKKVTGGLLLQKLDTERFSDDDIKVVTEKAPTAEQMEQLKLAMKVVKQVKSNAIVLVKDNATVGVGPGQTNRVTALELAIKYAGKKANGAVLASDAFFPFSDCVEMAEKHGITAIIQPGGSIKDQDSIDACNKAGISMVFTGMRHFKH